MPKLLKLNWRRLRIDIDIVILILLAILFAILGFFGLGAKFLSPVIVAMLSVLAISQLRIRWQVEGVQKTWRQSRTDLLLDKFPEDYYKARSVAQGNYFFAGVTMRRTLATATPDIVRILRNDGAVRILLPDPGNESLMKMIAETREPATENEIKSDIEYSIATAERLHIPGKGKLEIRIVSFLPGLGINAIDVGTPSASIMVQVYEFSNDGKTERSPIMFLTEADGRWLEHFEAQIERLWAAGTTAVSPAPSRG